MKDEFYNLDEDVYSKNIKKFLEEDLEELDYLDLE